MRQGMNEQAMLRAAGLRATGGRLALLRLLLGSPSPLSLDDAAKACGREGGDRATVYRNLLALAEAGIVREVRSGGRRALYEVAATEDAGKPDGHAHAHAVCTACGTVECVDQTALPKLGAAPGWRIASQEFTLWGECPGCQDSKPKPRTSKPARGKLHRSPA